jgi:hypothetical protein
MGDNSDDFVSSRGEPTTNQDKSTLPEGWQWGFLRWVLLKKTDAAVESISFNV